MGAGVVQRNSDGAEDAPIVPATVAPEDSNIHELSSVDRGLFW